MLEVRFTTTINKPYRVVILEILHISVVWCPLVVVDLSERSQGRAQSVV